MSYNLNQTNGGFESLSAAGLAEGTNANTYKTANTLGIHQLMVFSNLKQLPTI